MKAPSPTLLGRGFFVFWPTGENEKRNLPGRAYHSRQHLSEVSFSASTFKQG